MMDSETKLSAQSLKHFLTTLAVTQKRIAQKQRAKSQISDQIQRIKDLSAGARQKSAVMEELENLEKKVGEMVEAQVVNSETMKKLQEKIQAINPAVSAKPFADFERISSRLSENVMKLGKIGETEERLEKEVAGERSEILAIEQKLKLLEQKFNNLKSKKGTKKEDLARLRSMIDSNKKILAEIKQ